MSSFNIILYAVTALFILQGLALAISPQRAIAFQRWKYRLIGARPAEPGTGTVLFYRIIGVASLVMGTTVLIQLLSE